MRGGLIIATALLLVTTPTTAWAGGDADVKDDGHGTFSGQAHWKQHQTRKKSTGKTTKPEAQTRKVVDEEPSKREQTAFLVMCREAIASGLPCTFDPKKDRKPSQAQMVGDLSTIARTLLTRIQLPDPTPQIGPDPKVNEWKMAAVGYPLWLWTAGPHTVTDRVRAYGVTFTLRATWVSSHFDMGDGHSVTCTTAQPYTKAVKPGAPSPTCGYTYLTSSLPKGNYTVTATTNWRIAWSALGMSGSMPGSFSGTRSLPVGELNALVVK